MYRLLQKYTFEICTLSKIMNVCCKYNIFGGTSLFTNDKKVHKWFRTHVHWFATVVLTRFSFSLLICVCDWKKYSIGYLYTQTSHLGCFRRVLKILEGRVYQNCKFHDPWGRGAEAWPYKSYTCTYIYWKCIISLNIFFSTPRHRSYKPLCSTDDQGKVYQNCKFHDPWGRGSCERAWPY